MFYFIEAIKYFFETRNRIQELLDLFTGLMIFAVSLNFTRTENNSTESTSITLSIFPPSGFYLVFLIVLCYVICNELAEFEASFIRLLDKLTNGSRIEVNETGTAVLYQPGLLHGGCVEHDCSLQRSISYFLEPLMALAPFCKRPLHLTLRGITNDQVGIGPPPSSV